MTIGPLSEKISISCFKQKDKERISDINIFFIYLLLIYNLILNLSSFLRECTTVGFCLSNLNLHLVLLYSQNLLCLIFFQIPSTHYQNSFSGFPIIIILFILPNYLSFFIFFSKNMYIKLFSLKFSLLMILVFLLHTKQNCLFQFFQIYLHLNIYKLPILQSFY